MLMSVVCQFWNVSFLFVLKTTLTVYEYKHVYLVAKNSYEVYLCDSFKK